MKLIFNELILKGKFWQINMRLVTLVMINNLRKETLSLPVEMGYYYIVPSFWNGWLFWLTNTNYINFSCISKCYFFEFCVIWKSLSATHLIDYRTRITNMPFSVLVAVALLCLLRLCRYTSPPWIYKIYPLSVEADVAWDTCIGTARCSCPSLSEAKP